MPSDEPSRSSSLGPEPSGRILLGVDPGLRVTGYGLVLQSGHSLTLLDHGAVRTHTGDHPARLIEIYEGIGRLLVQWRVDEFAIEKQFMAVNASSAFAVGEARAVAIMSAALAGIPVFEYTPAEVKQAVTSYGRSSKEQIQEMVRIQFGLRTAPQPADAADALAIAICHSAMRSRPATSRQPSAISSQLSALSRQRERWGRSRNSFAPPEVEDTEV
jgi:crossover junction endodeoxyribonuclease RuvC